MPIYEYECMSCTKRHEIFQKFSDAPLTVCPGCGGEVRKLISSTSFVLKGTGWYKTDYAGDRKKSSETAKGKRASSEKTEAKSEKKPEPAAKAQ